MKVWYKNVGDQDVTVITPDGWDRPGESFFNATCESDSRKYKISWSEEVPTLADNPSYQEILAEEERIRTEEAIRRTGSSQLLALGAPYSAEERETWMTQESEARAWTADNSAQCPMITAMATTRGIPLSLMVQKIIENSDLFKTVAGQVLGAQQKALDLLE